jgi:hypothetical protein
METYLMSRALPFTQASLARRIKGVQKAGLHVVGVKPDATLIVAEKPVDVASLVPEVEEPSPPEIKSWRERLGGKREA